MKCWELANDKPEKNWLNFGSDPDNIVDIVSLQVGRKCCHLTTDCWCSCRTRPMCTSVVVHNFTYMHAPAARR